jgi:hypothetical protein
MPMEALLNGREQELDAQFRNAIFGCLMNETLLPNGLSHSSVRRALAAADRLPRAERRRAVEQLMRALADSAGGDELRRFVACATPREQLVQVVCPNSSEQAQHQAWGWVEETHTDRERSHVGLLTVGIVWVPTAGVWLGRARLHGA